MSTKSQIEASVGIGRPRVNAPLLRGIAEAASLQEVKDRGARPSRAGDGIHPCAPARGPSQLFRHEEIQITEAGNFRVTRTTGPDANALRLADAFDVMEEQAARRAKSQNRDHSPLFTPWQVAAGRAFAEVSERVAKGGVKCSSVEAVAGGGGSLDFMDSYTAVCERLRDMQSAIGSGWAFEPKNASPHRDKRRAIRRLELVHMVTVEQMVLSRVLERFGWSRATKHREALRSALCTALDAIWAL